MPVKTEAPKVEKTEFKKLDPKKIKAGDMMAITYFVIVKESNEVTNPKTRTKHRELIVDELYAGMKNIEVQGDGLIEYCYSADQYSEEKKITMTACAELLSSAYNRPFTVCFIKDKGEERVLRGRLIAPEPFLGRSKVEDLDLPLGTHRMRLVDHRTVKWLVLDGVKHVVK